MPLHIMRRPYFFLIFCRKMLINEAFCDKIGIAKNNERMVRVTDDSIK